MPFDEGVPVLACVRVVVVGGEGVGKSALSVRYLNKRYIGEYQHSTGQYNIHITPCITKPPLRAALL